MMFKRVRIILLVILLMFNMSIVNIKADVKVCDSVLIIYENEKKLMYNENVLNHLSELLYVFNTKVYKKSIDDYKKSDMKGYDSVFVINILNNISNTDFLEDLSNYTKNIYWIGENIENYLEYSKNYNISYASKNSNINKLIYKDKEIFIQSGYCFDIVNKSKQSIIIAEISDGFNRYPYIITEKNLYYISRWDLINSYIFEDSLNDFYEIKEFKEGQIFVRIEDVHPFRDTARLREIADYLYSENVPFMIALIPTYVDSETKAINTLDSVPDFIETIKYMQDKGGSVILHGYTHQIGEEEISGEGYEFWDMKNDMPIEGDIEVYVRDRLLSGLRLCIENEIYPLAFEAPHYAMNIDGYKVLKKYFSTYVGQFQNNNENFTTSTFPYIIKDSDAFNRFIPENLGFIEEGDDFAVDKIKDNFEKLSMVRGYSGGFFYHPYMDIDYLKECISYFRDKDVKFIDLKSEENYIKIDDVNIESKNGSVECSYDKSKSISKPQKQAKSTFDKVIKNINDIVIEFIIIILVLFFLIFIIFRKINNNKFKRR